MALKTFVKIGNVNNLSNARYCAGMMVDIIGFNIDPTSNSCISETDFNEIVEWVSGPQYAGEFYNAGLDQIKEVMMKFPIDLVQIQDLSIVEKVHQFGKPIIFKIHISSMDDYNRLRENLDYLDELVTHAIITTSSEQFLENLDHFFQHYSGHIHLLKGYGLDKDDQLHLFKGLALEASEEERPGFQDYGKIMDVLESLEED